MMKTKTHIRLLYILGIIVFYNYLAFGTDPWPKCPPSTLQPIYVIGNGQLNVYFQENELSTTYKYQLFKEGASIYEGRAIGTKLTINLNDYKSSFDQIRIQKFCEDVGSRFSSFENDLDQLDEIDLKGGLIMSAGECIFIKSQLEAPSYNIVSFDLASFDNSIIDNSSDSIYTSTLSETGDLNQIYLTIPGTSNIYFELQERNFSLDGIINFPDARQILDYSIEAVINPSCENEGGTIEIKTSTSDPAIFSIDAGLNWQNESVFSQLEEGNYKILVRIDKESCIYEISTDFNLEGATKLQFGDLNIVPDLICINGQGSIAIESPHDKPNISYTLSNGFSSDEPYFDQLSSGYYSMEIQYGSEPACNVIFDSIYVKQDKLLKDTDVFIKDATDCKDGLNGEIKVDNLYDDILYSADLGQSWQESLLLNNLGVGEYRILVRDIDSTCFQTYRSTVYGLDPTINLTVLDVVDPICYGDASGSIAVELQFGNDLKLKWDNGSIFSTRENLSSGNYALKASNPDLCYNQYDFTLSDPDEVIVENPIEDSILYLCDGSEILIDLDSSLYDYEWTLDGTSFNNTASIKITTPGLYNVRGYDEADCSDDFDLTVVRANEIFNPNFLLPSVGLVNDTVVGVELTFLTPDSLIWEVPGGSEVISTLYNQLAIVFAELGEQTVRMYAYRGDCWSIVEKTIDIVDDPSLVEKDAPSNQLIFKTFMVRPNPNDGNFAIDLELNQEDDVRIVLYDQSGAVHHNVELDNITTYTEQFSLANLPKGIYVLMVNTSTTYKVINVVID